MRRLLGKYALLASILALTCGSAVGAQHDPGVSATEVTIGQTFPYSGPLSAYATAARLQAAYFRMVNDSGGINGRKLKFISVDDGFSPPKTVEQVRRLVEQEGVFAIFGSLGTPTNAAVMKYLNQKQIPHIFLNSGAAKFNDPRNFPWTTPGIPAYRTEARLFAARILSRSPHAKVAVLFQNDDFGKDYMQGFRDGLGEKAARIIVAEASYEPADPTVDSQIISLKSSGADTLVTFATVKAGSQAIRKIAAMGWKPLHFISYPSSSIESALKPAGVENAVGLLSTAYLKDPSDPRWREDKGVVEYLAWMSRHLPQADPMDTFNVSGYNQAQLLVHVLQKCGDELTRANLLKQATSLREIAIPMLRPGITYNTTVSDYALLKQLQIVRFDGRVWAPVEDSASLGEQR